MAAAAFDLTLSLHDHDAEARVVALRLREGLDRRTHAEIEVAYDEPVSFAGALGQPAEVMIRAAQPRRWTLVLGEARYLGHHHDSHRYLLELHDPLWLLKHTLDLRKYRHQTTQQIVTKLLDEHSVDHRWETGEELPERKYCVQYHESELHFIERLLAFEGIFYVFAPDGTLVLRDSSLSAPTVADDRIYELIEASDGMHEGTGEIHAVKRVASLAPGSVTLGDYNWKKPGMLLRQKGFADRDSDLEHYEFPAGYREPAQGARLAAMRIAEKRSRSQLFEGIGSVPYFEPGSKFTFGDTAGPSFEGEWVLLELEHRYRISADQRAGLLDEDEMGATRFWALPAAKPFRPQQRQRPTVSGGHTALVRGPTGEEIHTDRYGRFRAQWHWDREATESDADSRWMRKVQEVGTGQNLARVGWEVFASFVDGDPDRPIGIGRAINGAMPPAYALPDGKNTFTLKTPSSPATGGFNELRMTDSGASQQIYLRAEKDLDTLVKNDKSELIGHDETHSVGNDFVRQVTGDQNVHIGGNATATYGNDYELLVEGDRAKTVGVNEKVEIAGSEEHRIGGDEAETVGTMRFTMAGSFQIPDLGAMAQSAALTFASKASPGASSLQSRLEGYESTIQNPSGALPGGGDAEGTLTGLGEGAAQAGVDAVLGGGGASDAARGFQEGLDQGLEGMLPPQSFLEDEMKGIEEDFETIVPTQDSIGQGLEAGADAFTGGLYSSLKGKDYHAALGQAIDLFFTGDITRQAESTFTKMVGGASIQTSVKELRWDVGVGYLETIGGAKLTATKGEIETTSGGEIITTVGGAMLRTSTEKTSVHAGAASTINVGGAMNVYGGEKIELRGNTVTITAGALLQLDGGGATITMTPASIAISGELKLDGGSKVKTSGQVYIV